jgi:hypothetical protein
MKSNPALAVAVSIAVLFCIGLIYLNIRLVETTRQLNALRATSAAEEAHMVLIQGSIDAFKRDLKQYDEVVGSHGTLQMLAKRIDGGEMDLSLKSLKIVSKGKSLVSLGSVADSGGVIQLASSDGTSSAEISAAPGKSLIGLKAATGADPAHVVHVASYGAEGYTLQKGPSDDAAAKTDGAGLQILDEGADFYLAQSGGGNVSIGTSSADERAKLSIWSEGNPRKGIYLSLGTRDITPFVSVTGAASGDSLTLLPDRLSLANRDGTVVLAAAEDSDGGYVFVNDKAGSQRVLMTANADGKGTISVFGNDNRSNTLYPEYNIQKIGSTKR